MHLLLIEGSRAESSKIQELLERHAGELLLTKSHGLEDAVQQLDASRINVVLVDLTSSDLGLPAITILRDHSSHVPIVVLANEHDREFDSAALARGADDCITRQALSFDVLDRSIRYVLERRRRQRAEAQSAETRLDERNRISQELHDGVLQSLCAIRMRLQMLAARVRIFDQESSQRALRIADGTLETIEELRRISKNLYSSVLDAQSLAEALACDAARLEKQFDARIVVRCETVRKLCVSEKHHLYRIFQESVHNSIRHGGGDINVELAEDPAGVKLRIQDNGRGFDVGTRDSPGNGLGLSSIRERAQLMGGMATIESRKNRGTLVCVELPAAMPSQPSNASAESGAIDSRQKSDAASQGCGDTVVFSTRDTAEWKKKLR